MSESTLEQVKRLAEQLSPEDRLQLWYYLAALPDSGIQFNLEPPTVPPEDRGKTQGATVDDDKYVLISTETNAAILFKGKLIFQISYDPVNFRQSRMEIRSWKDSPPPESLKQQVRSILKLQGIERTEEEIIETCKEPLIELGN
jgi:hypothetical protein